MTILIDFHLELECFAWFVLFPCGMRVDCHAIILMGLRAREAVTHGWWCGFTAFRLTQYHHHYVCVRVCVCIWVPLWARWQTTSYSKSVSALNAPNGRSSHAKVNEENNIWFSGFCRISHSVDWATRPTVPSSVAENPMVTITMAIPNEPSHIQRFVPLQCLLIQ